MIEEQEVNYHPQRAFVDVSDVRGGLAVLNRGLRAASQREPGRDGETVLSRRNKRLVDRDPVRLNRNKGFRRDADF